jgi:hypothetical protein
MLLTLVAGCTGLVAKSDTAKTIDADSVLMKARIASMQPAKDLSDNAVEFRKFYDGATVNPLAYLFGPKTIYCTAKVYRDLQGMAARSAEYANRATTQPPSGELGGNPTLTTNAPLWLKLESTWLDVILREKEGK